MEHFLQNSQDLLGFRIRSALMTSYAHIHVLDTYMKKLRSDCLFIRLQVIGHMRLRLRLEVVLKCEIQV